MTITADRPAVTNDFEDPNSTFFEPGSATPVTDSDVFLSSGLSWDAYRSSGIDPLNVSDLDGSSLKRREFLRGAELLGLGGGRKSLHPQQLMLADVCNADFQTIAVLLPRRSSKTTSIFALALGRCAERDDYLVGYTTCTTGSKARDRFKKDIAPVLERLYPDAKNRPFKIVYAGGQERIVFDNGSIFQILPPKGENFRSDAFDLIILDEAGEADPEMGEDLLAGVLPTFDTRPDAQLIIAGTAAKYRDGNLLWDALVDGRAGLNQTGILEYAAPDDTTDEELDDWDIVEQLVLLCHPGINTLTTLATIRTRWNKLKRFQFAEEYLSIFGTAGATSGIVNMEQWDKHAIKCKVEDLPNPPEKFALAIAVHPDQLSAAIVAVWREKDQAKLLLIDHRNGVNWLAGEAVRLSRKYRTAIVHDTTGPITVEVEAIERERPKPRLAPQSFPNVKTAAALLVKDIKSGKVDHFDQEPMNEAAKLAKKRSVGPTAWALGRKLPEDDIVSLEAAAMGLRVFDEMPKGGGGLKPNF